MFPRDSRTRDGVRSKELVTSVRLEMKGTGEMGENNVYDFLLGQGQARVGKYRYAT